jgi:hypothetical protein
LLNQLVRESSEVCGEWVQFDSSKTWRADGESEKRRKSANETKALLSACSVTELSDKLWCGETFNIRESKVSLPERSNAVLPKLEVDIVRWTQWMNAISRAAETRPGLETLIVCAFISAMHHPSCADDRKHILAGGLELILSTPTSRAWFSAEAVNWLAVFSAVLESPGLYSEALMNV